MRIFSNEKGSLTSAVRVDNTPVKILWDNNLNQMTFTFLTVEEKKRVELTVCLNNLNDEKEIEKIESLMNDPEKKMEIMDDAFWMFRDHRYISEETAIEWVDYKLFSWRK